MVREIFFWVKNVLAMAKEYADAQRDIVKQVEAYRNLEMKKIALEEKLKLQKEDTTRMEEMYTEQIQLLNKIVEEQKTSIEDLTDKLAKYEAESATKNGEVGTAKQQTHSLKQSIEEFEKNLKKKEQELDENNKKQTQKDEEYKELVKDLHSVKGELAEKHQHIER